MDEQYKPRLTRRIDHHYFSKFWVSVLILTILAYVVAVFYFSWHGKYISDALHYAFFPAMFGQLANMMLIERKRKDVEIALIKNDSQR